MKVLAGNVTFVLSKKFAVLMQEAKVTEKRRGNSANAAIEAINSVRALVMKLIPTDEPMEADAIGQVIREITADKRTALAPAGDTWRRDAFAVAIRELEDMQIRLIHFIPAQRTSPAEARGARRRAKQYQMVSMAWNEKTEKPK
jgi:hypothetical protein